MPGGKEPNIRPTRPSQGGLRFPPRFGQWVLKLGQEVGNGGLFSSRPQVEETGVVKALVRIVDQNPPDLK